MKMIGGRNAISFLLVAILVIGGVFQSGAASQSQDLKIVAEIPLPEAAGATTSLAWNNGTIYSLSNKGEIYQVNRSTEQSSLFVDLNEENPDTRTKAIASSNHSIWLLTNPKNENATIYELDIHTGEIIGTFTTEIELADSIAFDGEYIWVSEYEKIHKIDLSTGETIRSVNNPGSYSLSWRNNSLWGADSKTIYQIDPTLSTQNTLEKYSVDDIYMMGLTWEDEYLWISGANNVLYRLRVSDIGTPNKNPIPSFTYSIQQSRFGSDVLFNATDSRDPDGTISTYEWDIDGDNVSDLRGKTVTYRFTTSGTHRVSLTVTDNQGGTKSIQKEIRVKDNRTPNSGTSRSLNRTAGPTKGNTEETSRTSQGNRDPDKSPQNVPSTNKPTQDSNPNKIQIWASIATIISVVGGGIWWAYRRITGTEESTE